MKILYDHQAFTMQYYGGVSKCFCELLTHLPSTATPIIGINESNNIHLKNSGLCPNLKDVSIDYNSFISKYKFKGKGQFYRFIKLLPFHTTEKVNINKSIELLKGGDYDIFHPTFFDDYFLKYLNGKPFVLTIHDMMPELFPEYYRNNDMQIIAKKKLVHKAAAIIAVSEQTKKDIIDILNVPSEKIHVIYHGGPTIENLKGKTLYDFPYFLYVGQRDAYKNFTNFLVDFSKFISNHRNVKLICTGPSFTNTEHIVIQQYNLCDNIFHIKASDKELKFLYANALAFIYPSLYEGFGMPILEAFAYGCPVLLNEKSCFPEIAKDAALYFNLDNIQSNFLEVVEDFFNWSDVERNHLIDRGYKRLKDYSWSKSAYKLNEVYEFIVNKR